MYLITVLWSAHGQFGPVGAPRKVRDSMRMSLQGFVVPKRQRVGVKIPNDDAHVFGACGQLEAVGGESAIPDLLAVI